MPNIQPPKAVISPSESIPIPVTPLLDGVIVCIDKKTNRHIWKHLEDIKYCGMTLKEYLDRQERRIAELEKQVKKNIDADIAWKTKTNELLETMIQEIQKGE